MYVYVYMYNICINKQDKRKSTDLILHYGVRIIQRREEGLQGQG